MGNCNNMFSVFCACLSCHYLYTDNIYPRYSRNLEANASEYLENHEGFLGTTCI